MPTWGEILNETRQLIATGDQQAIDRTRKKYIKQLADATGRDTIVYATRWTTGDAAPNQVSITDEDVLAFMEAISGLKNEKLDLILHTGGGSAEATDAIVSYLRQKFKHIRIIIPQAAMSAGTMLACSADEIIMAKHSSIGPIDPQFILQTSVGVQALPAHAILEQFEMAQKDCSEHPKNLNSWLPMLSQYGPALLVRCKDQIKFGKELVENWLKAYMFKDEANSQMPGKISDYLSNHKNFKTHGKHISIDKAIEIGLKITSLENDNTLQENMLSAFHATIIAFSISNCSKIVTNQNGNAFIKQFAVNPLLNMQPQRVIQS